MQLGIDIGGTSIKAGVLDGDSSLIALRSYPTEADKSPDTVQRNIKRVIQKYLAEFPDITSVGVGVPGVVDKEGTVILAPNLKGWTNIPFGHFLKSFLDIPVRLDNDANAGALAEMKLGAGADYESFLYVTLGTGVGGAIVHERKLFRGTMGGAGEIGHLIIDCNDDSDDIPMYRQGTLEELVGRKGILALAAYLLSEKKQKSALGKIEKFDVEDIARLAAEGDPLCNEVLGVTGFYLGTALAGIMNILDIPTAVLGGGISNAEGILFEATLETIRNHSLPSISTRANIIKAKFEEDTGVVGAALLGGE